ncbi:MAG: alpha/beta fold hydrolase [Haloferacaceae archaeon]
MRLRRLLGYAALLVGTLAAVTRGLRGSAGALEPPLDGVHHTFRWRGIDVAYTEAGDPDDPTLVCLHGVNAAGSSGEFREVFADLATDHHVIAPDLPGFGRSDRPPLAYSAAFYEDFVAAFLAEFDSPSVLASGLTATYAVVAARGDGVEAPADAAVDVERLLLVCPTAVAGPDPPRPLLRALLRAPLVGEALYDLVVSRPAIRYFNADHGYYDIENLSPAWADYEWRTAHQPGARYPVASFVSGHLDADVDLAASLADLNVPTTLLWGREAEVTPLADGREMAERSDARLVVFDDALLLPHVEFPDAFAAQVRVATGVTAGDGTDDRPDVQPATAV